MAGRVKGLTHGCPILVLVLRAACCFPAARQSLMMVGDVLETNSSAARRAAPPSALRRASLDRLKVLAIKTAGEGLGLPSLSAPGAAPARRPAAVSGPRSSLERHRWKAYARARGAVTVFRARLGDLLKLVEAHPEMEPAVKQIVTQQETDLMVAEAMRELRLFNTDCQHGSVSSAVLANA